MQSANFKPEQCRSNIGEVILPTVPHCLHSLQNLLLPLLQSFQCMFEHDQPVEQSVLLKSRIRLGLQVLQLDLDAILSGDSAFAAKQLYTFLLLGSDLLQDSQFMVEGLFDSFGVAVGKEEFVGLFDTLHLSLRLLQFL